MVAGATMTNVEKIKEIIRKNHGFITRKDANNSGIPSAILSSYVRNNKLQRHAQGFYSTSDWIKDDYLILQYSYPKLIYSFYCAAYLNFLGDYIPISLEVTAPKNYRPFNLPTPGIILHTDTKKESYSLGIVEAKTIYGNVVRIYNPEKTVCDFIKNRKNLDSESFVKCLNFYKKRKDKDINLLMQYAEIMKIKNKVTEILEILLNED